ncbi:MAG TPA: hypothetical protein VNN19_09035 [bacterium]|nr:hypothetical protein [bacterium]
MKLNPVARGDLRVRLAGAKIRTTITLYLAALALLALLSLPPDLGRLDELRQEGLLVAFLVVEAVLVVYLVSAAACGELAIEGEKSVVDLAASSFAPDAIAVGKLTSAALFAALLVGLGAPMAVLVAGIRGEPLGAVPAAGLIAVAAACALGTLAALYGALFESEFARSFVHWLTLLAVIVGATALPAPWDLVSPVRLIVAASRGRAGVAVVAVLVGYLAGAVLAAAGIARSVRRIRAAPLS